MPKILSRSRRGVSFLTALFFLATNLYFPHSGSSQIEVKPSKFEPSGFTFPQELGMIDELSGASARGKKTVLLLQDAHTNSDAQRSIEKILKHLSEHYQYQTVALEGGRGGMDALLFRSFPQTSVLRAQIDGYLERGEISGATASAIFNPQPLQFVGIEDLGLYQREIDAFLKGISSQEPVLQAVEKEESKLEGQKAQFYSPELLSLDQKISALESEGLLLIEILQEASRWKEPVQFPLVQVLLSESKFEKAGDLLRIRKQIKLLSKRVYKFLNADDRKWISAQQQAYQTQQIDVSEYLHALVSISQKRKIKIQIPKELLEISKNRSLFKRLKAKNFLKEFNEFVWEVEQFLADTPEAKATLQKSKNLELLKKLISFELTPDEWVALLPSEFQRMGISLPENQMEFYRTAQARDNVFHQNLVKLLQKDDGDFVVFVGGGFHARGLAARLAADGIPYAVISPRIRTVPDNSRYFDIMQGKVSWSSHFKIQKGQIDLFESFNEALSEELAQKTGPQSLKPWRDKLIRALAAQGRTAEASDYTRFIDRLALQNLDSEVMNITREKWGKKIESFIQNLKRLVREDQLTDKNLIQLFASRQATPIVTNPLFRRAIYPEKLLRYPESLAPAEPVTRAKDLEILRRPFGPPQDDGTRGRAEVRVESVSEEPALSKLAALRKELEFFLKKSADERTLEGETPGKTALFRTAETEFEEWNQKAKERITRSDREEAIQKIIDQFTVEPELEQGSLIAYLVGRDGAKAATEFASQPHAEWLAQVRQREAVSEATRLHQEIETFKATGEIANNLALHQRLVKDLAARKGVKIHELLTQDVENLPPYETSSYKLKTLFEAYTQGVDPKGQRRIKYFLEELFSPESFTTELGFPIRERMRDWEKPESKDEEQRKLEEQKIYQLKIRALVRFMDYLAGKPGEGAGHVWTGGDFEVVADPRRRLADVLAENVFRSRWIDQQGNSESYSLFHVFRDVGFRTGGMVSGTHSRNDFYRLVEVASVFRSFQYFEGEWLRLFPWVQRIYQKEGVDSFGNLPLRRQIRIAHVLLNPRNRAFDDEELRDRLQITRRYDLTKRVFARITRDYLTTVFSWQNFLEDVLSRFKEESRKLKMKRDFIWEFKEKDVPVLSLVRGENDRVPAFITYGRDANGQLLFEDLWELEKAAPFEQGKSMEQWTAMGTLVRRSFVDDQGREALKIEAEKIFSVAYLPEGRIVAREHPLLALLPAFSSTNDWTHPDWQKHQVDFDPRLPPEPEQISQEWKLEKDKKTGRITQWPLQVYTRKAKDSSGKSISVVSGIVRLGYSPELKDYEDRFWLLDESFPFTKKDFPAKTGREFLEQNFAGNQKGTHLYNPAVVARRSFVEIYQKADGSEAERPVLDVEVDPATQRVTSFKTYTYGPNQEKLFEEERLVADPDLKFEPTLSAEEYLIVAGEVKKRVFFDSEGKPVLMIEQQNGKVQSIERYWEISRLKKGYVLYPAIAFANQGEFQENWKLEDWLGVLPQPLYSTEVKEEGEERSLREIEERYQEDRKLLREAAELYEDLEGDRKIPTDAVNFSDLEELVEKLDVILKASGVKGAQAPHKVIDRYRQLAAYARLYPDLFELSTDEKNTIEEALSHLPGKEPPPAGIRRIQRGRDYTAEDVERATDVLLKHEGLARAEVRSLGEMLPKMDSFSEKAEPKVQAIESYLRRMGVRRDDPFSRITDAVRSNRSTAWHSALAAVDLLSDEETDNPIDFKEAKVLDDGELIYAALLQKGFTPEELEKIVDLPGNGVLVKIREADSKPRNGLPNLDWNPHTLPAEQFPDLMTLARDSAHHGQYDVVTVFFNLDQDQATLVAKLRAAHQLLKENGRLLITLAPTRGFDPDPELQRQLEQMGYHVEKEGIGYNQFTTEKRNELLDNQPRASDVVDAENEIKHRQFYVSILRKSGAGDPNASADRIRLSSFPMPKPPVEDEELPQEEGAIQSKNGKEQILRGIGARDLKAAPLMPRSQWTSHVRRATDERRQIYRELLDDDREKLRLVHKYRHLLLDENTTKQSNLRRAVVILLNRTYGGETSSSEYFKKKAPSEFWKSPQLNPWVLDENGTAQNRKTIMDSENNPRFTIQYRQEGAQRIVTQILIHGPDGYFEPRLMKQKDFVFDSDHPGTVADWEAREGKVYFKSVDLKAGRKIHKQIREAYQLLEEHYYHKEDKADSKKRVFREFPRFDRLFEDETAKFIEEFQNEPIVFPYETIRQLIPQIFQAWRLREPVTFEQAKTFVELRKALRRSWDVYQRVGREFRAGQKQDEDSEKKSRKLEAERHRTYLFGNPSFFSEVHIALLMLDELKKKGGKLSVTGIASGTGALVWGMYYWKVPVPDGVDFRMYESDLSQDNLDQPRPPGYEHIPRIQANVANLHFLKDESEDMVTASFIADFPPWDIVRDMFLEVNRVLKIGGKSPFTLPQSWRPSAELIESLKEMGFDVTTPTRRSQKVKKEWLQKIEESYPENKWGVGYGRSIADRVKRMREKEFVVLEITKKRNLTAEERERLKNELDPDIDFGLEKTDTGTRGAVTGEHPIEYSPEEMRRWAEVLKWLLKKWTPADIELEDPDQGIRLTRAQVLEKFPEIETEKALERLYQYRHVFPQSGESNDYELIVNLRTYWNSQADYFYPSDIDRLAQLYKRGPPRGKGNFDFVSVNEAVDRIISRAQSQKNLVKNKKTEAAKKKLSEAADEAIRFANEVKEKFDVFKKVHKESYLLWPEGDPNREIFQNLYPKNADERAFSVQRLVWIENFLNLHTTEDDLLLAAIDKAKAPPKPAPPPAPPPVPATAPKPADPGDAPVELPAVTKEFLESSDAQRELFGLVGKAIETLLHEDRKQFPEISFKTSDDQFPDFEEVIALLPQLEEFRNHPLFGSQSLANGSPLFEQIKKQVYQLTLSYQKAQTQIIMARLSSLLQMEPQNTRLHVAVLIEGADGRPRRQVFDVAEFEGGRIKTVFMMEGRRLALNPQEGIEEERITSEMGLKWNMERLRKRPEFLPNAQLRIFSLDPKRVEKDATFINLREWIERIPQGDPNILRIKGTLKGIYEFAQKIDASIFEKNQEDLVLVQMKLSNLTTSINVVLTELESVIRKPIWNDPDIEAKKQRAEFLEDLSLEFSQYFDHVLSAKLINKTQTDLLLVNQWFKTSKVRHYHSLIKEEDVPGPFFNATQKRYVNELPGSLPQNMDKILRDMWESIRRKFAKGEPETQDELSLGKYQFAAQMANAHANVQLWQMSDLERLILRYYVQKIMHRIHFKESEEKIKEEVNRLRIFLFSRNVGNRLSQLVAVVFPRQNHAGDYSLETLGRLRQQLPGLVPSEIGGQLLVKIQAVQQGLADPSVTPQERIPFLSYLDTLKGQLKIEAPELWNALDEMSPDKPFEITNPWLQRSDLYHREQFSLPSDKREALKQLVDANLKRSEVRTENEEDWIRQAEKLAGDPLKARIALFELLAEEKGNEKIFQALSEVIRRMETFEEIFDVHYLLFRSPGTINDQPNLGLVPMIQLNEVLLRPGEKEKFLAALASETKQGIFWTAWTFTDFYELLVDEKKEEFKNIRDALEAGVLNEDPLTAHWTLIFLLRALSMVQNSINRVSDREGVSKLENQYKFLESFTKKMLFRFFEYHGFDSEKYYGLADSLTPPSDFYLDLMLGEATHVFRQRLKEGRSEPTDLRLANRWLTNLAFHYGLKFPNPSQVSLKVLTNNDPKGRTRFQQIVDEEEAAKPKPAAVVPVPSAYDLNSPAIQKDMYAMMERFIEDFTPTAGGTAPTFDFLMRELQPEPVLSFHPAWAGQDLSKGSPLYEAFFREYKRYLSDAVSNPNFLTEKNRKKAFDSMRHESDRESAAFKAKYKPWTDPENVLKRTNELGKTNLWEMAPEERKVIQDYLSEIFRAKTAEERSKLIRDLGGFMRLRNSISRKHQLLAALELEKIDAVQKLGRDTMTESVLREIEQEIKDKALPVVLNEELFEELQVLEEAIQSQDPPVTFNDKIVFLGLTGPHFEKIIQAFPHLSKTKLTDLTNPKFDRHQLISDQPNIVAPQRAAFEQIVKQLLEGDITVNELEKAMRLPELEDERDKIIWTIISELGRQGKLTVESADRGNEIMVYIAKWIQSVNDIYRFMLLAEGYRVGGSMFLWASSAPVLENLSKLLKDESNRKAFNGLLVRKAAFHNMLAELLANKYAQSVFDEENLEDAPIQQILLENIQKDNPNLVFASLKLVAEMIQIYKLEKEEAGKGKDKSTAELLEQLSQKASDFLTKMEMAVIDRYGLDVERYGALLDIIHQTMGRSEVRVDLAKLAETGEKIFKKGLETGESNKLDYEKFQAWLYAMAVKYQLPVNEILGIDVAGKTQFERILTEELKDETLQKDLYSIVSQQIEEFEKRRFRFPTLEELMGGFYEEVVLDSHPIFRHLSIIPKTPLYEQIRLQYLRYEYERILEQAYRALGQMAYRMAFPGEDLKFNDLESFPPPAFDQIIDVTQRDKEGSITHAITFHKGFMRRPYHRNSELQYVEAVQGWMMNSAVFSAVNSRLLPPGELKSALFLLGPEGKYFSGIEDFPNIDERTNLENFMTRNLQHVNAQLVELLKTVNASLYTEMISSDAWKDSERLSKRIAALRTLALIFQGYRVLLDDAIQKIQNAQQQLKMQGKLTPEKQELIKQKLNELFDPGPPQLIDYKVIPMLLEGEENLHTLADFQSNYEALQSEFVEEIVKTQIEQSYFGAAVDTFYIPGAKAYRPVQERNFPIVGLHHLKEEIFKRITSNQAAGKRLSQTEAAFVDPNALLRQVRAYSQIPLWRVSPREKNYIRILVVNALRSKSNADRVAAMTRLERYVENSVSRRYLANMVLREEAQLKDYPFETMSAVFNETIQKILPDAPLSNTVSELFMELKLLMEATDDPTLSSQLRFNFLVRSRGIANTLEDLFERDGKMNLLDEFFAKEDPKSPFAWYAPRRLWVSPVKGKAPVFRSVSELWKHIESLESIYDPQTTGSNFYFDYDYEGILNQLVTLLRDPAQKEEFKQTLASAFKSVKTWNLLLLAYPVNRVLDDSEPAFAPIRDALVEGAASDDPKLFYSVFSMLQMAVDHSQKSFATLTQEGRRPGDPLVDILIQSSQQANAFLAKLVDKVLERYGLETENHYALLSVLPAAKGISPRLVLTALEKIFNREIQGHSEKEGEEAVRRIVRYMTQWAAFGRATRAQLESSLEMNPKEPGKTKFHRMMEAEFGRRKSEGRSEVRADWLSKEEAGKILSGKNWETILRNALAEAEKKGNEERKKKLRWTIEALIKHKDAMPVEVYQKLAALIGQVPEIALPAPVSEEAKTGIPPDLAEAFKVAEENKDKTLWHMTDEERLKLRELVSALLRADEPIQRQAHAKALEDFIVSENSMNRFLQIGSIFKDEAQQKDYPLPLLKEIVRTIQKIKMKITGVPATAVEDSPAELTREIQALFEAMRNPVLSRTERAALLDTGSLFAQNLTGRFTQAGLNADKEFGARTGNEKVKWWFSHGKTSPSEPPELEEIIQRIRTKIGSPGFQTFDVKKSLEQLNQFLENEEGRNAFRQRLLSGHFAEDSLTSLLIAAALKGISLKTYPHLMSFIMESSLAGEFEQAMATFVPVFAMLAVLVGQRTPVAEEGLNWIKELFFKRIDQWKLDDAIRSNVLGLSGLTKPLTEWFPKGVIEEAFLQGLEEGDVEKIQYQWLKRNLRFKQALEDTGSAEMNEILGMENGLTRFDRILNTKIPDDKREEWEIPAGQVTWRDRYNAILAEEKARLSTGEMQKTFYAMAETAVRDYEKRHFEFPENFGEVLPTLRMLEPWKSHPRLQHLDLTEESPLYEAMELAFRRGQFVRLHQEAYRMTGQQLLTKAYPEKRWKFNFLLRLKHPSGDGSIQNLTVDAVEVDSEDRIVGFYFLPTAPEHPFVDSSRQSALHKIRSLLALNAELSKNRDIFADKVVLHEPEFFVSFLEPENNEASPTGLPPELKSKTHFVNPEAYLQKLKALEGEDQRLSQSVEATLTGLRLRMSHFSKASLQSIEKEIQKGKPLHDYSRLSFYPPVIISSLPPQVALKANAQYVLAAEHLLQAAQIYMRTQDWTQAGPEIEKGKQVLFSGLAPDFPSSFDIFFDPLSGKYRDDQERVEEGIPFISVEEIYDAMLEAAREKRAEVRVQNESFISEALTSPEYAAWIANQNAGVLLWNVSDEQREDIRALVKAVVGAGTDREREENLKNLENYISIHDSDSLKLFTNVAFVREFYDGDYNFEQIQKAKDENSKLHHQWFPENRTLAEIYQNVQLVEQALNDSQFRGTLEAEGARYRSVGTEVFGYVTKAKDDVLAEITSETFEIPGGRELEWYLGAGPLFPRSKELTPKDLEELRTLLVQILYPKQKGDSIQRPLTELKVKVKNPTLFSEVFMALASKKLLGPRHNPAGAQAIREVILSELSSIKVIAGFLPRIVNQHIKKPPRFSSDLLEKIEQILVNPEERKAFNEATNTHWISFGYWVQLLLDSGKSLDDVPHMRLAILESVLNQNPLIRERGLEPAAYYYQFQQVQKKESSDSFYREYLEVLFNQYGFDYRKYLPLLEHVGMALPSKWNLVTVALENEFRKRIQKGETLDPAVPEKILRMLIALGNGTPADLEKALEFDPNDPDRLTRFERIVAEHERAKYDLNDLEIQKDFYAIVGQAVEEFEKEHFQFPDWKSVSEILGKPGRLSFHPALRGLIFTPGPEAYAALEKQYQNLRREKAIFQARRALNQLTAFLSTPEAQWEMDVDLQVPDATQKDGHRHYLVDAIRIENDQVTHVIFNLEGLDPFPNKDQLPFHFAENLTGLYHIWQELKQGKIKINDRKLSPQATYRITGGPQTIDFLPASPVLNFLQGQYFNFQIHESFRPFIGQMIDVLQREISNPILSTNLIFTLGAYLRGHVHRAIQTPQFLKKGISTAEFTPFNAISSMVTFPSGEQRLLQSPSLGSDIANVFATGDTKVFDMQKIEGLWNALSIGSQFYALFDPTTTEHIIMGGTQNIPWEKTWKPLEETTDYAVELTNNLAHVQLWQMTSQEKQVLRSSAVDFLSTHQPEKKDRAFRWLKDYVSLRNQMSRVEQFDLENEREAGLHDYPWETLQEDQDREFSQEWLLRVSPYQFLQLRAEGGKDDRLTLEERRGLVGKASNTYDLIVQTFSRGHDLKTTFSKIKNPKIERYVKMDVEARLLNPRELEKLLENADGYSQFTQAIENRHLWPLQSLSDNLLKELPRTALDFQNIRDTFLRMFFSENPLLSRESFSVFSYYWIMLREKSPRKASEIANFIEGVFYSFLNKHGFDTEKYYLSFEAMLEDPLASQHDPNYYKRPANFIEVVRFVTNAAERVFWQGLKEGKKEKVEYQKFVQLLNSIAARMANLKQRDRMLKIDSQGKNFFERILDEGDNRKRYEEIMSKAPEQPTKRAEVRTALGVRHPEATKSPKDDTKRMTGERSLRMTLTYILAGRVPPEMVRNELRTMIERSGVAGLEIGLRNLWSSILQDKEAFASQWSAVSALETGDLSGLEERIFRLREELKALQLEFQPNVPADVAMVLSEKPEANLFVSILKSEPAMSLVAIWNPEKEPETARVEARVTEEEVNRFVGGEPARFKILVPQNEREAERMIRDASRVLYKMRGKTSGVSSVASIQSRLVYIYPSVAAEQVEKAVEWVPDATLVRHSVAREGANAFGKKFVLLKGAAEISQDISSQLMRLFQEEKKSRYFFDDSRVSSEWLALLASLEADLQNLIAQSA